MEKRLPDSASRGVEKRQYRNRLFTHEGRLLPSEIREKRPEYDQFWAIPAAFNHRLIQKIIALL
jgi:hypothetical protein